MDMKRAVAIANDPTRNGGGKAASDARDATWMTAATTVLSAASSASTDRPTIVDDDDNVRTTTGGVNVMSYQRGARILFCTDEWFSAADNLLQESPPAFDPDAYCPQGKVMDGWESRRKRQAGHDWCIVQLSEPVTNLQAISIDTAFFTGNQTPQISIQAMNYTTNANNDKDDTVSWMPGAISRLLKVGSFQGTGQSWEAIQKAEAACAQHTWTTLLERKPLQPGYPESRYHTFPINIGYEQSDNVYTHVRINYYPDGGVARIKLWGQSLVDTLSSTNNNNNNTTASSSHNKGNLGLSHDLAALSLLTPYESRCHSHDTSTIPTHHLELSLHRNGGKGLGCSNAHYGIPNNLIQETQAKNMGDGWETARHTHRPSVWKVDAVTGLLDTPLMDWAILELGMGGATEISRIVIDTQHFRGNYPESVSIECADSYHHEDDNNDNTNHHHHHHGESHPPDDGSNKSKDRTATWSPLLPRTRMTPDAQHIFDMSQHELVKDNNIKNITHVRICIFPDGGISRVRIYGAPRTVPPSHL